MVDKIELPQGAFHPELIKSRREIEAAQQRFKEDPGFTQRHLDKATRDFHLARLKYDRLDQQTTVGLKQQISNLNEKLAGVEV